MMNQNKIWIIQALQSFGGGHGEGPTHRHYYVIGYFLNKENAEKILKQRNEHPEYGTSYGLVELLPVDFLAAK